MFSKLGGGGENVTEEVLAQSPIIQSILESLVGKAQGATASAETILKGFSAYVDGNLVDGEYDPATADTDLIPENIREGIDIFGVLGTMAEGVGELITFTPSSNVQSITVQHNLKKAPYAFILIGKNDTNYGIKSAVYPFYGVSYGSTTCGCRATVYNSSSNISSEIDLTTEITDSQITLNTGSSSYYFNSGTEYTIIAIA